MSAYIQQKAGLSGPKFSSNAGILWILARHIWFEQPEHAFIVTFLLSPCVFLELRSARVWVPFPSITKSPSFGSCSHELEGHLEMGHRRQGGSHERKRRKSQSQRWRLWSGGVPAAGVTGNPVLSLLPPILLPGKSLQQLPPAIAPSG